MALNIGDTVRFLNSVGGGRVVRVDGQVAYIVDDDGFEVPALVRECVVVASGDSFFAREQKPSDALKAKNAAQAPATQPAHAAPQAPELPPLQETAEGEKLTLQLAFEPADIKRLPSTSFDAFMVNDSNYSLYIMVATRPNESDRWTVRFRGLLEPAIQEFLFEITPEDLPDIDRIAVQAFAFKSSSDFSLKAPVELEQRLDPTKFARLHCFAPNEYFESSVLAVDIIKDDVPAKPVKINSDELKRALEQKQRDDRRKPRPVAKSTRKSGPTTDLLEVDLHAAELLDNLNGLSPADILNYQIDTFRRIMDQNLSNIGRPIVFIHGKGEGVLRGALMKELNHRYKGHDVADASFREYGFGATKVTIRKIK